MSATTLLATLLGFAANVSRDPHYAATHPRETAEARVALFTLRSQHPHIAALLFGNAAQIQTIGHLVNDSQVVANMSPGVRELYNQLLRDDPQQAKAFLLQEMMASVKLMNEMLSNVMKTRSEISMQFARNIRG